MTCLADPETFLMDHLLALKPVKFLEGEPIHNVSLIHEHDEQTFIYVLMPL